MDWGVGDLLAVTKLAWDLYHNCYLVAREAPDDFRQLVSELGSLQQVLKNLRDDLNSDKSFMSNLDDNRKQMLERCVTSCHQTLRKLQALVIKYKELGIGDGLQFWKRIRWVNKKNELADMKARILAHTCQISLCMSSMGNSSLSRIEASLQMALERQEAAVTPPEHEDNSPLIHKPRVMPSETMEADDPRLNRLSRQFTGTTIADVPRRSITTLSSTPPKGNEPDFGASVIASRGRRVTSASENKRNRSTSMSLDPRVGPPSPFVSEDGTLDLEKRRSGESSTLRDREVSISGEDPYLKSAIDTAMGELSKVRQQEQQSRPLRIPPQRNIPLPDGELKAEFESHVQEEMDYRRLNTKDWLRIGTWWLLKARFHLQTMERSGTTSPRGSVVASIYSSVSSAQAYVDLLKASWILFEVILKGDYSIPLQADENRKLFYNLSDGIAQQFRAFRNQVPDADALQNPDINYQIFEHLSADEETLEQDIFGSNNSRWITVEEGHAGLNNEKVLFRTFVDAAIGGRGHTVHPKGAPYMITLSTTEGQSEPKVTIVNQSGSLGLTRDFTIEDLDEITPPSSPTLGMDYQGQMDPVQLPFDDMDTAVAFTNENDLHRFMYIPRTYFNAVALREPKQLAKATETLIFKSSIDIVEELNPSTMKIVSRRHKYHSCDLRILETTHTEGWRTIRRLVISSSAGEKHPWCREYFLPKDRVQLSSGEVGREIKVKWSDCVQEDYTKTDGKYHTLFSHIYDDTKPNHAFSFLFHDELDCKQFQQKILKLSSAPAFTCAVNPSETCAIYDIQDTEPTPKTYRAILVTYKRLDWTYSQLFYTFRDTDFRYDQRQLRIHFTQLQYCDYVSSHVQRLHKPEPHSPPRFSHCEKKLNQLNLDFSDESISQTFLSALSSHTLIFSRRAHHISTKQPRFGGASKSNKGAADVQIWKKGNNMRLVTRWGDLVEDRWLSMSLSLSALKYSIDNNRVSLPNTIYDRGKLVDIVNLVAVKPKEKSDGRRTGYVTIAFETSRDQEEFIATVEGRQLPPASRNPIDDILRGAR